MMKYTDYTIPEEIDSKIPDYFYSALAGELYAAFGYHKMEDVIEAYENETEDAYPVAETAYFSAAFSMTCKKLDMLWLLVYKSSEISYFESVDFGEIMCERVAQEEAMQQIAELTDGKVDRAEKDKYFEYIDNMYDTFCSVLDDILESTDSYEDIVEEYQRRKVG
jgi:hypothetical protein